MSNFELHELSINLSRTGASQFWFMCFGVEDNDEVVVELKEGSAVIEEWKGKVIETYPKKVGLQKVIWAKVEVNYCSTATPDGEDEAGEEVSKSKRSNADLLTVIITVTSKKETSKKSSKSVPAKLD